MCSQHMFLVWILVWVGLLLWLSSEESTCNAGDTRGGFSPRVWKILWRRKWNPLQYPCLGTPRNRGAWRATVHGITESWTQLSETRTLGAVLSAILQQTIGYHGMQWPGNKAVLSSESTQEICTTDLHPSLQKIVVLKFLRGRKNKEQKCRRN